MKRVIGVDPGPTPGIVMLDTRDGRLVGVEVVQCTAGLLTEVLAALHASSALVAFETFVVRGRASADQRLTRDQTGLLRELYPDAVERPAARVKPWATDDRLAAAGLDTCTKGMRHARDAARHALYTAVHDGGLTDPISKEWNR